MSVLSQVVTGGVLLEQLDHEAAALSPLCFDYHGYQIAHQSPLLLPLLLLCRVFCQLVSKVSRSMFAWPHSH